MHTIVELFSIPFMQRAILAGVSIGILLAIISFFVVIKELSFIGVGISHCALAGIAIALLFGLPINFTLIVFSLFISNTICLLTRKTHLTSDTTMGIFFPISMAIGILIISLMRAYNTDLFGYLFGNILAINNSDIKIIISLVITSIILIAFIFKWLLFIIFDEEVAQVSGLPTTFILHILYSLIGVSIVISIKMIGIVLVSAFLVIPAATGLLITHSYKIVICISITVAVVSVVVGLCIAYVFDTPPGATIVCMAFGFFLLGTFYRMLFKR